MENKNKQYENLKEEEFRKTFGLYEESYFEILAVNALQILDVLLIYNT